MKKLLIGAALLAPVIALATDVKTKDKSSEIKSSTEKTSETYRSSDIDKSASMTEAMTPTQSLSKLHHVNMKHVELGNLAQVNSSSDKVKQFGAKLVRDHQRLDKQVIDYAKDKNITLSSMTDLKSSTGLGSSTGTSVGSSDTSMGSSTPRSSDTMGSDTTASNVPPPPSAGGSIDRPSKSASDLGSGNTGSYGRNDDDSAAAGSSYGSTGTGSSSSSTYRSDSTVSQSEKSAVGDMANKDDWKAKLDKLRGLRGSEFDREFFTNVIDSNQRLITIFEGVKNDSQDAKFNSVIDRALNLFRDENREAQRLQGDLIKPAS